MAELRDPVETTAVYVIAAANYRRAAREYAAALLNAGDKSFEAFAHAMVAAGLAEVADDPQRYVLIAPAAAITNRPDIPTTDS